jgi:cytochrome P450
MPAVTELDLPHFDYFSPDLRGGRFHETMLDLRGRGWLARNELAVFVLDREAGEFFLRSRATTFPGLELAELFGVTDGPLAEEMRRNILHINGDDHRRLRNLVNPAFTPRAADRYRPVMRGFLDDLWAGVRDAGRCEFVGAIAKPYPALTIATVLGAPADDAPRLHEWSNTIQRQFDGPFLVAHRPRIEAAVDELYAYLSDLLERRRATPGDDLISTLLAAEAAGDRLSDVELVNLVLNVLIGGIDTTQSQLAHAVRLLAEHPDQWAALRADPGLADAAVQEALRYEPITPFTARIALEELEYRGVTFPQGTIIMVSAFTGNRDPADHDEPDRFDIAAPRPRTRLLTFGAGVHYCLGANLAQAELQEALRHLADGVDELALDGEPVYEEVTGIYGLAELPLRMTPSRAAGASASAKRRASA